MSSTKPVPALMRHRTNTPSPVHLQHKHPPSRCDLSNHACCAMSKYAPLLSRTLAICALALGALLTLALLRQPCRSTGLCTRVGSGRGPIRAAWTMLVGPLNAPGMANALRLLYDKRPDLPPTACPALHCATVESLRLVFRMTRSTQTSVTVPTQKPTTVLTFDVAGLATG